MMCDRDTVVMEKTQVGLVAEIARQLLKLSNCVLVKCIIKLINRHSLHLQIALLCLQNASKSNSAPSSIRRHPQVEFITRVVVPLYPRWAEFVRPDADDILAQVKANNQWSVLLPFTIFDF